MILTSVVILITAFGDVEMAVRALKAGCDGFYSETVAKRKTDCHHLHGYTIEAIVQPG